MFTFSKVCDLKVLFRSYLCEDKLMMCLGYRAGCEYGNTGRGDNECTNVYTYQRGSTADARKLLCYTFICEKWTKDFKHF